MTVDTTYEPAVYTGDGNTTAFALNHKVFQASHLSVKINGLPTAAWSATGYGGSGVTVTFDTAPASGATVTIERIVPYTQDTDLENFDGNPADVTERQFDLLAMADQQIAEEGGRSILVPVGTSIASNEISGTIDATERLLTITTSGVSVGSETTNVDIVADNIDSINTVSGSISNVNTVAGDISNVNTVASNIAFVNDVAVFENNFVFAENIGVLTSNTATQNASALQTWIDGLTSASQLYFPAGTYSMGEVNFNTQAVKVFGDGPASVIQQETADYGKSIFQFRVNACRAYDLKFNGNHTRTVISGTYEAQPARGRSAAIYIADCNDVIVQNCEFDNFNNGVHVRGDTSDVLQTFDIYLYGVKTTECDQGFLSSRAMKRFEINITNDSTTFIQSSAPPHAVYLSDGGYAEYSEDGVVNVIDSGNAHSSVVKANYVKNGRVKIFAGASARGLDATQFEGNVHVHIDELVDASSGGSDQSAAVNLNDCGNVIVDYCYGYIEDSLDTMKVLIASGSTKVTINNLYGRASRTSGGSDSMVAVDDTAVVTVINPVFVNDGEDKVCVAFDGGDNNVLINPTLRGGTRAVEVTSGTGAVIQINPDLILDGYTSNTVSDSGTNTLISVLGSDLIAPVNAGLVIKNAGETPVATFGVGDTTEVVFDGLVTIEDRGRYTANIDQSSVPDVSSEYHVTFKCSDTTSQYVGHIGFPSSDAAGADVYGGIMTFDAGGGAATDLLFAAGSASGLNISAQCLNDGDFVAGLPSPATTATGGFLQIPQMAGAPTGNPSPKSGYSSIVHDNTNNRLYVHNGSGWSFVALT